MSCSFDFRGKTIVITGAERGIGLALAKGFARAGGRIVIFGGGDPLPYGGEIVGGIGVSGGSAEEDTALSAYGAELFFRLTHK